MSAEKVKGSACGFVDFVLFIDLQIWFDYMYDDMQLYF